MKITIFEFDDLVAVIENLKSKKISYLSYFYSSEAYANLYFPDSTKDFILFKFLLLSDIGTFYYHEKIKNTDEEMIQKIQETLLPETTFNKDFEVLKDGSISIK